MWGFESHFLDTIYVALGDIVISTLQDTLYHIYCQFFDMLLNIYVENKISILENIYQLFIYRILLCFYRPWKLLSHN